MTKTKMFYPLFFPPGVQIKLRNRLDSLPVRTENHKIYQKLEALWLKRNEALESNLNEIDIEMERLAYEIVGPQIENHNMDGIKPKPYKVYNVPLLNMVNAWDSVTDIPCPVEGCEHRVLWYENGYVPGYRVCMKEIDKNKFLYESIKHRLMAKPGPEPKLILLNNE